MQAPNLRSQPRYDQKHPLPSAGSAQHCVPAPRLKHCLLQLVSLQLAPRLRTMLLQLLMLLLLDLAHDVLLVLLVRLLQQLLLLVLLLLPLFAL